MTDFYTEAAQDALDLITEFGRDVQHRAEGSNDLVTDKPWRGHNTPTPVTIKAAVFDATEVDRRNFPSVDFTKTALMAAQGLSQVPRVEDYIIDIDRTYRVARVVTLQPGDTPLTYTLLLAAV